MSVSPGCRELGLRTTPYTELLCDPDPAFSSLKIWERPRNCPLQETEQRLEGVREVRRGWAGGEQGSPGPRGLLLTSESGSFQEFPKVAANAASLAPGSKESSGRGRKQRCRLRPQVFPSLLHQPPHPLTFTLTIVEATEALSLSPELVVTETEIKLDLSSHTMTPRPSDSAASPFATASPALGRESGGHTAHLSHHHTRAQTV